MRHSVKIETHKRLYTITGFRHKESNSGAVDLGGFALIPTQMQQATRCLIVWCVSR